MTNQEQPRHEAEQEDLNLQEKEKSEKIENLQKVLISLNDSFPSTENATLFLRKVGLTELATESFKVGLYDAIDIILNQLNLEERGKVISQITHWPKHMFNTYRIEVEGILEDGSLKKQLGEIVRDIGELCAIVHANSGDEKYQNEYNRAKYVYEDLGEPEKVKEMEEKIKLSDMEDGKEREEKSKVSRKQAIDVFRKKYADNFMSSEERDNMLTELKVKVQAEIDKLTS